MRQRRRRQRGRRLCRKAPHVRGPRGLICDFWRFGARFPLQINRLRGVLVITNPFFNRLSNP